MKNNTPFIVRFGLRTNSTKPKVATLIEILDDSETSAKYYLTICHDMDNHRKTTSLYSLASKMEDEEPFITFKYDGEGDPEFDYRLFTESLIQSIKKHPNRAKRILHFNKIAAAEKRKFSRLS